MTRHIHRLPVFLTAAAAAAITLLIAPSILWALRLTAAQIRFEINGTAGDGGVQFFLDGQGWKSCEISRPDGNHLVTVTATISDNGSPGTNGLTELFIESAEPSFADQSLAALLALFPAGRYEFDCLTTDDKPLKSSAQLTHKLPGTPAPSTQFLSGGVVRIAWPPVVGPFEPGGQAVVIVAYQIIVERLSDGLKFDITLPALPANNRVTVPEEFIRPNTEYKGEVLAIEASGNQTIGEFEFTTP
jgi:hypothetical protein